MTCEQFAPLLSRYYDDMLDTKTRHEVHAHIQSCGACSARFASYREMESRIGAALTVTPSPNLRHAVIAATVERAAHGGSRQFGRRHSQVLFGGLAGASVAALVVALFAVATSLTAYHRQPTRVAVQAAHKLRPVASAHPTRAATSIPAPTRAAIGPAPKATPTSGSILTYANNLRVPTPDIDKASLLRITRESLLTRGAVHGPLWSPDGASLLFLTNWGVHCRDEWYCGTLKLYSARGTISLAIHVRSFSWSPDGRYIAYTSERVGAKGGSEAQDLHVVQRNGQGDRELGGADRTNIGWFSSGIIVVQHGAVVVVNPKRDTTTPLSSIRGLKIADDSEGFLALSAGARLVAYQDGTGLRVWDRGRGGVLVLRQRFTRFSESSFHFSWDGKTIFYSTYDNTGYTMLYRQQLAPLGNAVALNSGRPLHGPINLVGPPSADNSVVSFRIGSGATAHNYVIDSRNGPAHSLLPPTGVGPVGWWSPDGRHLVYTVYHGGEALYTDVAQVTK